MDITADLPSRHFAPQIYGLGAWTDHVHFAYDLVARLRPRMLVELGTDRGESYFAFCQSAAENQTGSRCFAVDHWRGDSHAGLYDETTFEQVAAHNREHYESFSRLLRMDFEEPLSHFADESVDVLHLDGLHTEEAVRRDLDFWLPKLRPGGLLLLHDVAVRRDGFGVGKVWDELFAGGKSFVFPIGPGLGVWQKPQAATLPTPLESLLAGPSAARESLVDYYQRAAHALQSQIAQSWRDGSIRQTPFAQQTVIQVFFSTDGSHREEDSIYARIGHDEWKTVNIPLPAGAAAGGLRIDFVSAFTTIDLAEVGVRSQTSNLPLFHADEPSEFGLIRVAGEAERVEHPSFLRIKITGIDPQLFLPPATAEEAAEPLELTLRICVHFATTRSDAEIS
jgi:hypothetical protein